MWRVGTSPGRTASSWLIAWAASVALLFFLEPRWPHWLLRPEPFEALIDRTGAVQQRFSGGEPSQPKFLRDGKPRFGYVGEFSEGLAVATDAPREDYWSDSTLFGYIDESGEYVIPPRFNWASPFSEGWAAVCRGACRNTLDGKDTIQFIDRKGKVVLSPGLTVVSNFSGGLAAAKLGAGVRAAFGYLDRTGKFAIYPRFSVARDFSEGLAVTDSGYINRKGDVVIRRVAARDGGDFSEGLAVVVTKEGRKQYIDKTGAVVLDPGYEELGPFSEGLAPACKSDCGPSTSSAHWGYIDRTGKFQIEPRFSGMPGRFRNGLARVCVHCTS